MLVPRVPATRLCSIRSPPSYRMSVPSSSSTVCVCSVTRETAAIDASASPRKPSERMEKRSLAVESLLVACRKNAVSQSSSAIPLPLSMMRMLSIPPFSISMVTAVAPASMEFSTSSLTTELGRSTTSPAAIWFAILGGSTCTLGIRYLRYYFSMACRAKSWLSASSGVR